MEQDVRWKQRFEYLDKALHRLHEAVQGTLQEPKNHLYQIALVGAFQFTFELSWKTMKDYLAYQGIDVSVPRDVIKQAFHYQLIQDGDIWIHMLEERNLMAHVYQEPAALIAGKNIRERYVHAIEQLHRYLLEKRKV